MDLVKQLETHPSFDATEAKSVQRAKNFVMAHKDCFERSHAEGHVTGSAWLLDPSGTRVLLTHHKKLNKWIQLGGHADGNPNILQVASREAHEESGLADIIPLSEQIYDVDVHWIPERPGESGHYHYDIRFILQAKSSDSFRVSDESHDLAWIHQDDMKGLELEESIMRMYRKWLRWNP